MKLNHTLFGNQLLLISATMLIALLWILIPAGNALAHGDGGLPRISYQQLGANYLHAWTSPAIPRTGEIHVEALVTDQAFRPTSNTRFVVKVTPLDGHAEPMQIMASAANGTGRRSTQNARPATRQEAGFTLEQPGEYEVEITILAAAGQGGRQKFTMQVVQVSQWIKLALQATLALLALSGIWLFIQGIKLAQRAL